MLIYVNMTIGVELQRFGALDNFNRDYVSEKMFAT